MTPPRAPQRASPRAPKPPRVYRRDIKKLKRVCFGDRTLHFTFHQGTGGGRKSVSGFVNPEHVPAFAGDEGWFEMELIEGHPGTSGAPSARWSRRPMPEPSASDRCKAAELKPDVASTLLVDCVELGARRLFQVPVLRRPTARGADARC